MQRVIIRVSATAVVCTRCEVSPCHVSKATTLYRSSSRLIADTSKRQLEKKPSRRNSESPHSALEIEKTLKLPATVFSTHASAKITASCEGTFKPGRTNGLRAIDIVTQSTDDVVEAPSPSNVPAVEGVGP